MECTDLLPVINFKNMGFNLKKNINMLPKEVIVEYFEALKNNYLEERHCDECPFRKECDILLYDSTPVLCRFMTQYVN